MTDDKKRWVAVYFPNGPFQGSVNLAINGNSVMTADAAKELIDQTEANAHAKIVRLQASKDSCAGCTGSEGETQVS